MLYLQYSKTLPNTIYNSYSDSSSSNKLVLLRPPMPNIDSIFIHDLLSCYFLSAITVVVVAIEETCFHWLTRGTCLKLNTDPDIISRMKPPGFHWRNNVWPISIRAIWILEGVSFYFVGFRTQGSFRWAVIKNYTEEKFLFRSLKNIGQTLRQNWYFANKKGLISSG